MKIMALDASTKSSGVAIFDEDKLVHYECVTASSKNLIKRINKMTDTFQKIMKEYSIDKIILEEVRPENGLQNIKTQKALMWLQAGIAFMVEEYYPHVPIEYVYPNQWRAACGIKTGRGIKRASLKKADIQFVKDTYSVEVNDDEADAIGIGHAFVTKLNTEINWE